MTEQLHLFDGEQLKEEALQRLENHNWDWMCYGLVAIRDRDWGEVTGEDLRLKLLPLIGRPHHHNAWGALIHRAVKKGFLTPTGRFRPMKQPRSHARMTPVYRMGSLAENISISYSRAPDPDLGKAWHDLCRAVAFKVRRLIDIWRRP